MFNERLRWMSITSRTCLKQLGYYAILAIKSSYYAISKHCRASIQDFLFLIQDFGLKNLWCKISDLLWEIYLEVLEQTCIKC